MLRKKYSLRPETRMGPGTINGRTLACAAVVIAAGLGLAACVGPYGDDDYGRNHHAGSDDTGYDQRRNAYGQDPYTPTDRPRSNYNWWRGGDYPRDHHDD